MEVGNIFKIKVDLSRKVATEMVDRYFKNEYKKSELEKSLACVNEQYPGCNSTAVHRTKVRIRLIEIDNRAVARVIARLDENRKLFVRMKWKSLCSDTRIGVELEVSKMTIYRWRDDFLEKLMEEGYLFKNIEILFMRIDDLPRMIREFDEDILYLRQFEFVDFENDAQRIAEQRNCLVRFLEIVNQEIELVEKEKYRLILREKFWRRGEVIDEVIADQFSIARSLVTMIGKKFVEKVKGIYFEGIERKGHSAL